MTMTVTTIVIVIDDYFISKLVLKLMVIMFDFLFARIEQQFLRIVNLHKITNVFC